MGMVVLRPSRKHEIVGRLDELQFPTVILKKQWRSVLYIYIYIRRIVGHTYRKSTETSRTIMIHDPRSVDTQRPPQYLVAPKYHRATPHQRTSPY